MLARRVIKRSPTVRYPSYPTKKNQGWGYILCSRADHTLYPTVGAELASLSPSRRRGLYVRAHAYPRVPTCAAPPPPEKKKTKKPKDNSGPALGLPHCWDTCARGARPAAPRPSTAFHTRDSRSRLPLVQALPETRCLNRCHLSQPPMLPFSSPQTSQIWVGATETGRLALTTRPPPESPPRCAARGACT